MEADSLAHSQRVLSGAAVPAGRMHAGQPGELELLLAEDDRTQAPLSRCSPTPIGSPTPPDGQAVMHAALTRPFAVMVIDRGLPAIEGIDPVRRLRSRGSEDQGLETSPDAPLTRG